jgi:hypothetical protein
MCWPSSAPSRCRGRPGAGGPAGRAHPTGGLAAQQRRPGRQGRRWHGWSRLPPATAGAPDGWERWLLVRRWRSWYRWVTLAMLAYAFLVVTAVTEHARHPPPLGAHPVDLQRDPAPVRGPGRPACRRPWAPVALVVVATPAPGPRPGLPLPTASQQTMKTMKTTISGWSTNPSTTPWVRSPVPYRDNLPYQHPLRERLGRIAPGLAGRATGREQRRAAGCFTSLAGMAKIASLRTGRPGCHGSGAIRVGRATGRAGAMLAAVLPSKQRDDRAEDGGE